MLYLDFGGSAQTIDKRRKRIVEDPRATISIYDVRWTFRRAGAPWICSETMSDEATPSIIAALKERPFKQVHFPSVVVARFEFASDLCLDVDLTDEWDAQSDIVAFRSETKKLSISPRGYIYDQSKR
ncbi:hypothetical protein ACFSCV_09740 [Methylopila henanensis]|uniref:Uncharacterized protein n=1 Tax=Methylopila henanensis TaxID=873516 RepID=A0ABW4K9H4_9HYPH